MSNSSQPAPASSWACVCVYYAGHGGTVRGKPISSTIFRAGGKEVVLPPAGEQKENLPSQTDNTGLFRLREKWLQCGWKMAKRIFTFPTQYKNARCTFHQNHLARFDYTLGTNLLFFLLPYASVWCPSRFHRAHRMEGERKKRTQHLFRYGRSTIDDGEVTTAHNRWYTENSTFFTTWTGFSAALNFFFAKLPHTRLGVRRNAERVQLIRVNAYFCSLGKRHAHTRETDCTVARTHSKYIVVEIELNCYRPILATQKQMALPLFSKAGGARAIERDAAHSRTDSQATILTIWQIHTWQTVYRVK